MAFFKGVHTIIDSHTLTTLLGDEAHQRRENERNRLAQLGMVPIWTSSKHDYEVLRRR